MEPNGAKWTRMEPTLVVRVPNGTKWSQMDTYGAHIGSKGP
jgi:hypothetical protein